LLRRQLVGLAARVIDDIAAGHLGVEPLADIALGTAGPPRDFPGTRRACAGHAFVETELVADADHDAAIAGGQVAEKLRDEVGEHLLIDGHVDYLRIMFRTTACRCEDGDGSSRDLFPSAVRAMTGSFVPTEV